jgi:hypothetical protein
MDFGIFPFVMIIACVVMMVFMMRRMGPMHGGRWTALWSGQMGCCGLGFAPRNDWADRLPSRSWWTQPSTSGNLTFDEYRAETLRRLEQEQSDFQDFLGRLRMAKDKAEFDQFMAERRSGQEA